MSTNARTHGLTRGHLMPRKKRDPRQPDAVDIAVGNNVRIWRIARGLSQTHLAERLGVTFQQVQKYETGANRMSTGRLVKATAILGVPMSALFERVGSDAEPSQEPLQALVANCGHFVLRSRSAQLNPIGSAYRWWKWSRRYRARFRNNR